jgi:SAM-dependent methyltransferase
MTSGATAIRWDPALYAANAGFVPAYGAAVLDLLGARPGERILDLGCGDGVLTQKLVEAGCDVVGVDADPAMVAAARTKGLDARQGDARALDFTHEFDAVFTNAALHWVGQPDLVTAGVRRALKPGGRYVGEFGGHANIAAIRTALKAVLAHHGFPAAGAETSYYPTDAAFRDVLERGGFVVDACGIIPRPTPLPASGMAGWLQTFRGGFIDAAGVPDGLKDQIIAETTALLVHALQAADGAWIADYVRLRFAAHLPE